VTIPDSVTSIGSWAFASCTGLTGITIPNSVTSIGGGAFYGCTALTSVTIPDSVTSIGSWALASCTGLTGITIPKSVTSIGGWAFYGCTALTSVTIPDSVTSIGSYAFQQCAGLTNATIGNGVTTISHGLFSHCSSLETLSISASVMSIGFGLDPDSGEDSFQECLALQRIDIDAANSVYASIDGVAFNKSMTVLLRVPPGKQGSYTVPSNVAVINDWAFYQCAGLTKLIIPISVVSVGGLNFGSLHDEYGNPLPPISIPIVADTTALATNDAFVSAVASKIVAALPDNYGIATKSDLGTAVSNAISQTVSQVQAQPNSYNLFNAEQYSANYNNGVVTGTALVTSNPSSYNLYTSNSIMDLRMGDLMIQRQGTNAIVSFQPQTTIDLTQPFTNNGTPIIHNIPMPGNKGFLRINAKP